MKTKTGKLLMMQSKARNKQSINDQQINKSLSQHITPIKNNNISSQKIIQNNINTYNNDQVENNIIKLTKLNEYCKSQQIQKQNESNKMINQKHNNINLSHNRLNQQNKNINQYNKRIREQNQFNRIMRLDKLQQIQELKNKQGQQYPKQKNLYKEQLFKFKQQNIRLSKQIQKLQLQLNKYTSQKQPQSSNNKQSLQITSSKYKQSSPKHKQSQSKQKQSQSKHKQSQSKNKQSEPKYKQLKILQQKQYKLQQKCNTLQIQNYRLIQTNYLLLLNLKKNNQSYKDTLLKIIKQIQNLQFSQAAKQIYHTLNKLKKDSIHSQKIQSNFFNNNQLQPKFFNNNIKQSPQLEDPKQVTPIHKTKLTFNPCIYSIQHYIQHKLQQRQNNIQIQLAKIPSSTLHQLTFLPQARQSSSFHLINQRNISESDYFPQSNKLFNSQIHQNDYDMSGLDQVSLHQKIQSEWQNKNSKQITVHKCHGNSTELYKMLMVQAMTIQGFFGI